MSLIKYILTPILALFSGCSTYSEEEILVNKIITQTAGQLKKQKGLRIICDEAEMMDEIKVLGMEFQYDQKLTLEESRELMVYCIETFLKNINENQKIRPYLANYPFTVKNIKIGIWMDDWNKTFLQNIELISASDGILTYKLPRPGQFGRAPILKEETYEEALEALKEHP